MLSYKYQYIDYKSTIEPYQLIYEEQKRIYWSRTNAYRYRDLTEEEWIFLNKYGLPNLCIWLGMSSFERKDLEETIKLYQHFWSLYYENYEDLRLYAIMYRNVPLHPTIDVASVKFFLSKAKEIRNYKEYISKLNTYKAKVALLYYNNEKFFTKILSRYMLGGDVYTIFGQEKNSLYEMPPSYRTSLYEKFSYGSSGVGIDNLTEMDCVKVLEHKDELIDEYKKIYKETLEEYVISEKGRTYSECFFTNHFITYCGRKGTKLLILRKEKSLDEIKKPSLIPVLEKDKIDIILSSHEYHIVNKFCSKIKERTESEEKVKAEIRQREWEQKRKEEEARREKFKFNQRNRHYRDSNISFDESTHLYKVNGVTLQSVTNFVAGCFPKFDAEFFAKKKATDLGKTTQEVLEMWEQKGKESRELGTELHKKIENHYQGISSLEDDTFKLFLMFADKVELKPYRTEWAVYDVKHNIAGTIDFVDYQNGEYIIYDWKRSDKIIDNGMPIKASKYNEKGNHPLEHLDNTPYYHYALQLSIYKYILENNYNIKISDLRLGIFHPTYEKPYVLRMPYLEKEINDIFGLRSEVLF